MSFSELISMISFAIGIVGAIVITWGSFLVVIQFLRVEIFGRFLKKKPKINDNTLRVTLGLYILLGLEFMIAGDIMHTLIKPTKESLIVLGSIVAIRTVISYFLRKELREVKG